MEKFCQSCAIPLTESNLGTEADGSKSQEYCNLCYDNGEFREPNLTYDDMLERGLKGIDNSKESKFKKWMFKKSYPMLLKKSKRWK